MSYRYEYHPKIKADLKKLDRPVVREFFDHIDNIFRDPCRTGGALDVSQEMERLKRWCEDINAAQDKARFDYVFVDEEDFERYKPDSFSELVKKFRRYKDG
jgi:type III restriction enzyme